MATVLEECTTEEQRSVVGFIIIIILLQLVVHPVAVDLTLTQTKKLNYT
jgi:hypothetical protein